MSFESILQSVVDECGGGLGIALMGTDGVPIVEVEPARDEAGGALLDDIGSAGAEFGRVLGEIRKASDTLGGGSVNETVVGLARFTLIFRSVDEDIVLVLALAPDGNLGKARYLMRRSLSAIRQEL